jgi:hypothetical protein
LLKERQGERERERGREREGVGNVSIRKREGQNIKNH